jgi:hypothetical protein
VLYNFPNQPGAYLWYDNSMTFNWKATSGERVTLPSGLTGGKTMLLGNGDGLDLSLGTYSLVERPENTSDW